MTGNWNWERPHHEAAFNIPSVVLAFAAVCVVLYVGQYFLPDSFYTSIDPYFVFVPSYSFSAEHPLTSISVLGYSFMHGSWMHLLANMVWFVVFGSPMANRIGAHRFIAFWIISAIVSILPFYFLHMHDISAVVGASGVISALMGGAGRYGFERITNAYGGQPEFLGPVMSIENALRTPRVLTLIGFWVLTDLAIGLVGNSDIAWEAHIAGLIFGFIAMPLFDPRPRSMY